MATSRRADRFFGPLVAMTYSLPKASLVPLFILWFGIGDTTNMLTVFLARLLPVVVSTYHGVKSVPQVWLWSAQAMGTSRRGMLLRILLPRARCRSSRACASRSDSPGYLRSRPR